MNRFTKVGVLLTALVLSAWAAPAEAGPITGSFSFFGNYLPVGSDGALTSLDQATAIDFIEFVGSTPTPGIAGEFLVNSANGDFTPLKGQWGEIKDLTFGTAGPFPTTPLSWFQSVGDFTFDLLTVAVARQDAEFLLLTGTGVFNKDGFDSTGGTFRLSANASDGTFSFSASDKASGTSVPEPNSLALFAVALLAGGVRFRKAAL